MTDKNESMSDLSQSLDGLAGKTVRRDDTIDTLRQRVAELEAAQQQGDPVLYQCTKCGGANYGCQCASLSGCTEPLYAAPQTCYSAADMADQGAKAAQVEREECAKVLDDVGARLQTDNEPDEFWRGVGATVEACEIAIRMRGDKKGES